MAKILITWELGGGSGHLVPLRPIVQSLCGHGHAVVAALRDVARAGGVFAGLPVQFLQAPFRISPVRDEIKPPFTFAHILHNCGFADDLELTALARAWRGLLDFVKPDLMICDHSPTALLAARGLPFRRIVMGSGFICPPDRHPLPNLRFWLKVDPRRLLDDEERLLGRMNRVLASLGAAEPMDRVTRIYGDVDATLLTTFRELDHYPERENTHYWGAWTHAEGAAPRWPGGTGPRIYAYLKNFPALAQLLQWLADSGHPTLAYVDGVDRKVLERPHPPHLRFESDRLDMAQVGKTCDLAILHATHGTTASILIAGKPIMQLPIFLEQGLMAHAVCRMGAGVQASVAKPEPVLQELRKLLSSQTYADAARGFARKYADYDPIAATDRVVAEVEKVLG